MRVCWIDGAPVCGSPSERTLAQATSDPPRPARVAVNTAFVTSDAENVRAALSALDAAFERRDLEAALALCTEDVVFIGSGEGEEAVGRDAIMPMFATIAPQLDGLEFSLSWDSVDVDVLGNVALLIAWGRARLISANRNEQFRYRLTGVLIRSDDRWLWRVHHGSEPGSW
jgi:uncharacterized protein (TIGR02246 family)